MKKIIIPTLLTAALALSACAGNQTAVGASDCATYQALQTILVQADAIEASKLSATQQQVLSDAHTVANAVCDPTNTSLAAQEEAALASVTAILATQVISHAADRSHN
jgi:hypothetical protein